MEGAGSAIIILRHLQRLAANGWKISMVSDWGQSAEICKRENWPVFFLPHRKFWWPPFNPDNSLSLAIRLWLWTGECYNFLGGNKPHAACTYLSAFSDLLSQVAIRFSHRYDVPLSVIIHDNPENFCHSPDEASKVRSYYNRVISDAHHNWFASPQLADIFGQTESNISVLPPIPEGWKGKSEWNPAFSERPLLVYAGKLWEVQISLLATVAEETAAAGGRLLLMVKKTPAVEMFCRKHPVDWKEPFDENHEALQYLSQCATALLVSYTENSDMMPWIRTSFPSKLVEYSHLGLPILIMAPEDSAVAIWARGKKYPYSITPDDIKGLRNFLESLKMKSKWEQMALLSRQYAKSAFNPETIQKEFESKLTV